MCRASGVSAEVHADEVPVIDKDVFDLIARDCIPGGSRENLRVANNITHWNSTPRPLRIILTDAQTSGGLLLCVKLSRLDEVRALVKNATVIGKIVRRQEPLLCISA
jgi:selenide,water dikinase